MLLKLTMLLKYTLSVSEIIVPFSIIKLLLPLLFKVSFVHSEVSIQTKYEERQARQGDVFMLGTTKNIHFQCHLTKPSTCQSQSFRAEE